MKKFRFQFETLEKVRKAREDEALRVLSEAQAKLGAAVSHKRALELAREQGLIRREQLGRVATRSSEFGIETDFITGQRQRILQAEVAIQRSRRAVEKALRGYLQAKRQTRVIEMLREKRLMEYKIERARYEQRQMDDISTMRNRLRQVEEESA